MHLVAIFFWILVIWVLASCLFGGDDQEDRDEQARDWEFRQQQRQWREWQVRHHDRDHH